MTIFFPYVVAFMILRASFLDYYEPEEYYKDECYKNGTVRCHKCGRLHENKDARSQIPREVSKPPSFPARGY